MSDINGGGYYLASFMEAFEPWLSQQDVTDLYVNAPGELWVERLGGSIERHEVALINEPWLARFSRQVAASSAQGISRAHPLLAASLPDGARIQIVGPPASRSGHIIAIRRYAAARMTLGDYEAAGAFDGLVAARKPDIAARVEWGEIDAHDAAKTLSEAVRARKNILISGGTSSGKTTFLNALLREIPSEERLILIEDTPELEITHANAVALLAVRGALGEAAVTTDDLLMASLRLRPDRIILGELRGHEAFTFLRSINTGHPGSMTTIHADSPQRAIEQLTLLVLQTGTKLAREDVHHYVSQTIDLFVQLGRSEGKRTVTSLMARV